MFLQLLLGQISPAFWRKAQMCQQLLYCTVPFSFTNKTNPNFTSKHNQNLNIQLLCFALYIKCQKEYCKSTSAKAAHTMLIELIPPMIVDGIRLLHNQTPWQFSQETNSIKTLSKQLVNVKQ